MVVVCLFFLFRLGIGREGGRAGKEGTGEESWGGAEKGVTHKICQKGGEEGESQARTRMLGLVLGACS